MRGRALLACAATLFVAGCGPRFAMPQPAEAAAAPPDGLEPAEPDALAIPRIEVTSRLVGLGLTEQRSMEVPDDADVAGWYVHGPRPGAVGPAVMAGHVDSRDGPGVFLRLADLEPGDDIFVRDEDGKILRFVVERLEHHAKDAFPTATVYGDTDRRELRLITCGGSFDPRAGSYRDNIIVYAVLAGWTGAHG